MQFGELDAPVVVLVEFGEALAHLLLAHARLRLPHPLRVLVEVDVRVAVEVGGADLLSAFSLHY